MTVRTMISDLYHNRSRGFSGAGYVQAAAAEEQGELSGFCHVTQYATPITLTAGAAPNNYFQMQRAPRVNANAFYLLFEEGKSTLATLTRAHRIVIGGGYSGCLYSVYHTGRGDYKCIHTARPGGPNADTYVQALRLYARDQRWTLIHEVPTVTDGVSGVGINGCVTTFLATRVSYTTNPRPIVRTVRLRQDSQGNSVDRHRWETPTP